MQEKTHNKIYAFISICILVLTSLPVVKLLLYSGGFGRYLHNSETLIFKLIVLSSLNSAFWLALAVLFSFDKIKWALVRNSVMLVFAIVFFYEFLVCVDRLLGLVIKKDEKIEGYIPLYTPHTKGVYKTWDLSFTADINYLGLRDRETIKVSKGRKYRVLCIGDSFVYGWGGSLDESWPKVLEKNLWEAGYDSVEVINGGRSGSYPSGYADAAAMLVSLLKPDLVLVGVLQLNDLGQSRPKLTQKQNNAAPSAGISLLKKAFNASFINTMYIIDKKIRRHEDYDIHALWKQSATDMIKKLTPEQKQKYETLSPTVKKYFESGDINPGFVSSGVLDSYEFVTMNDTTNADTKAALSVMDKAIHQIKQTCAAHNCQAVFVNTPFSPCVGRNLVKWEEMGYVYPQGLDSVNNIDGMYKAVAERNEMPYVELTDYYRQHVDSGVLYIKYDCHPTPYGYKLIGDTLSKYVIDNYLANQKINE